MTGSYNTKVAINKKFDWEAILETEVNVELVDPNGMDPEERTEFINGIYVDYKKFLQESKKDISMVPFKQKYQDLLVTLIKIYGH
tara:strand:+ start:266 stop:520 length:255 start_codon:yes stop_codon:yes gene_type:complete